jgi:hypothetical protein
MENQLKEVRYWAKKQIALKQEPPFEYRRLIQTIDAILESNRQFVHAAQKRPPRPLARPYRARPSLRLVDANYREEPPVFEQGRA